MIDIRSTSTRPVVGDPYTSECTGSVPASLRGTVTASWIGPDNRTLTTKMSPENATASYLFDPFTDADIGKYTCRVTVTSPVISDPIGAIRNVLFQPLPATGMYTYLHT